MNIVETCSIVFGLDIEREREREGTLGFCGVVISSLLIQRQSSWFRLKKSDNQ